MRTWESRGAGRHFINSSPLSDVDSRRHDRRIIIMLSEKLAKMISDQMTFELYSAYIYLGISNFFADKSLNGFANWYMIQTQEERDHAMLFNQYLLNEGATPELGLIEASHTDYEDFRTPLITAYDHERVVTARINDIYAQAFEEKDYRTMQFLDWFIKEQGEEEQNSSEIVDRFDLFGSDPKGLYMLDSELGERVYSAPSLEL